MSPRSLLGLYPRKASIKGQEKGGVWGGACRNRLMNIEKIKGRQGIF